MLSIQGLTCTRDLHLLPLLFPLYCRHRIDADLSLLPLPLLPIHPSGEGECLVALRAMRDVWLGARKLQALL